MTNIRPVSTKDRKLLAGLISTQDNFNEAEKAVAMELIDDAITNEKSDYRILVAETNEKKIAGYICFGLIPLTDRRYDLYWIAVDPAFRRHGIGGLLLKAMEKDIQACGSAIIYIETSSTREYEPARGFYQKHGYREACTLVDFYRPGDHKIIFIKKI